MNLIQVLRKFKTEDDCLQFLEQQRWPHGVHCPTCGCAEISRIQRHNLGKNKRTRIYQCLEKTCKRQFSATNSSVFHNSKLPLTTWFAAISLIMEAKKGISARQIQAHLGIGSYRSAWYMCQRIRKAMEEINPEPLKGVVEIDETYVGGKTHVKRGQSCKTTNKEIVIGMKERKGKVRLFHVRDIQAPTLGALIAQNVSPQVEMVVTDESRIYPKAFMQANVHGSKHKTINHSKGIYVNGDITTNGIESAFSLFKRGIVGSFHRLSIKHLHRYLAEFEYRFNVRKSSSRFGDTVQRMLWSPQMPYAVLIGEV